MKDLFLLYFLFLLFGHYTVAQNTVGLLQFQSEYVTEGYNLIYPNHQSDVYLLDNCGQIVHTWEDVQDGRPGIAAQLLPDGRLLRTSSNAVDISNTIGAGGSGGVLEILSWEGDVLWKRIIADSIYRQHHEAIVIPNGNVLLIAWERHDLEDIIQNGFDTLSNNQRELWSDSVIEIDVENDSIIWQWNSWDHLIQDHDSTKLNYGTVEDSVHKIDLNYQEFSFGRPDFMHCNSIDYNEDLDQILISNRNYNELWIIDHNILKDETDGPNGDLLWRWGNNAAFKKGDSQHRFTYYQHDAHWIDPGLNLERYDGSIAVYNNSVDFNLSLGNTLKPTWDAVSEAYIQNTVGFEPSDFETEFSHPDTLKNYSTAASSIQILENGNVLMHAGRQGRAFELLPTGEPVWEYLVPLRFGEPVEQGQEISLSQNFTFQLKRYPPDFSGFDYKDLTPKGYLELNPNEDFCTLYTNVENLIPDSFSFYPNPASTSITINSAENGVLELFDMYGRKVQAYDIYRGQNFVELHQWQSGLYTIKLNGQVEQLVIRN